MPRMVNYRRSLLNENSSIDSKHGGSRVASTALSHHAKNESQSSFIISGQTAGYFTRLPNKIGVAPQSEANTVKVNNMKLV